MTLFWLLCASLKHKIFVMIRHFAILNWKRKKTKFCILMLLMMTQLITYDLDSRHCAGDFYACDVMLMLFSSKKYNSKATKKKIVHFWNKVWDLAQSLPRVSRSIIEMAPKNWAGRATPSRDTCPNRRNDELSSLHRINPTNSHLRHAKSFSARCGPPTGSHRVLHPSMWRDLFVRLK